MALGIRGTGIVAIVAVLVLALLAYVWIDGGREPLREIAVPVAIPEGTAR
ncbi:MAG: hypothetical protein ACTHLU_14460 [Novosphingobium sp.]